jgi:hypothetical protein
LEVTVKERWEPDAVLCGQVDKEGTEVVQIPRRVGEVGEGIGTLGDIVGPAKEISNLCHVEGVLVADQVHVCGPGVVGPATEEGVCEIGPIGPSSPQWNPFVDLEDISVQASLPVTHAADGEGVQLEVSDDVAVNGVNEVVRCSQLSEIMTEPIPQKGKGTSKKNPKKGASNSNTIRGIPNQVGVPKFCQLAASMVEAGRRRKEANKKTQRGGAITSDEAPACENTMGQPQLRSTEVEEHPEFVLEVVLPIPSSGVNLLLDNDGESISESNSVVSDEEASRVSEAKVLMGIQKEVGFTFEGNEEMIQGKMVELEENDLEKKIEREQRRGFQ